MVSCCNKIINKVNRCQYPLINYLGPSYIRLGRVWLRDHWTYFFPEIETAVMVERISTLLINAETKLAWHDLPIIFIFREDREKAWLNIGRIFIKGSKSFWNRIYSLLWAFHPILVTSFLVVFGDEVTKILRNSFFIFHFVLSVLPCKRKTSYRKSGN